MSIPEPGISPEREAELLDALRASPSASGAL
jgi:hypothetical protein